MKGIHGLLLRLWLLALPTVWVSTAQAAVPLSDSTPICSQLTDLAARAKATYASLTWTDTGAPLYAIYRSRIGGGPYEAVGTTDSDYSTYSDTGLELSKRYYWVVAEQNGAGNDLCRSNEATAITYDRATGNYVPLITTTTLPEAYANRDYSATIEGEDRNSDDALTFRTYNAPAGLQIGFETGILTWAPTEPATYEFFIHLNDGRGGFDERRFTLTVKPDPALPPEDTTPPTVTAPADILVEATADLTPVDLGTATATDDRDGTLTPAADPTGPFSLGRHTVTWSAIDSAGNTGTDAQLVTVQDTTPPNLTLPNDIIDISDEPVAVDIGQATANDLFEPVTITHDAPGVFPVGETTVTWTAVDANGNSTVGTQLITLQYINNAPTFTTEPDLVATENILYQYSAKAEDADTNDILTYSLLMAPAGMSIDSSIGTVNWLPTNDQTGEHGVAIQVRDGHDGVAVQNYTLNVYAANSIPIIVSTPVTEATVNSNYQYIVEASDADAGDVLSYTFNSQPIGMTINQEGEITWVPDYAQIGIHEVVIVVTDSQGGSVSQSFQITVTEQNLAPELITSSLPDAIEDQAYYAILQAEDPNVSDNLTFSLINGPENLTLSPQTGELSWLPGNTLVGSHRVTVRVTDAGGLFDEIELQIIVQNANDAPTFTTEPPLTAIVGALYHYGVQAEDPDVGDSLTYSLVTAPVGMSIEAGTGDISWTPSGDQGGIHTVVLNVTDLAGATAEQNYSLSVEIINEAPAITSTPVALATVNLDYQYVVSASDPDGDTLGYALESSPAGMAIDSDAGVITWAPTSGQEGEHTIRVRVSDPYGGHAIQEFGLVVVSEPNQAPVISSEPPLSAESGTPYQYSIAATDPDGDALTYSLGQAPSGMSIDTSTGLIEWTPTSGQDGDQPVTVQVVDPAGLSDSQSFSITVAEQNQPPQTTTTDLPDALAGLAYQTQIEATDPNTGDVLSFALTAAPTGMTIEAGTGVIDWLPSGADVGTANLIVLVTDDQGLFDERSFSISVQAANQAPVINSMPVTEAVVGSIYSYKVQATDPDGDSLSYNLTQSPAGMSIDADTGLFEWTPTIGQEGDHAVAVQVSDGQGGSVSQSFTVQVIGANVAPVISSTPVLYAVMETSYHYMVNASDPDGDALTYSLHTAPFGMSINANTGAINWTPSSAQEGDHAVTVQVNDGQSASASQSFTVQVTEPNVPVIISTPVLEATSDSLYQYLVLATDPDGDALTFSLRNEPSGMSIDASTGLINWIPSIAQKGPNFVRVRVSKSDGWWTEQSFSIHVTGPNRAPVISSSPVLQANAESQYYYGIAASDPDGDALSYSLDVAPSGMAFNWGIEWTPTSAQIGDHAVTVQVSDGNGGSASQTFTIQVLAPLDSDYDGVPDFLDQCPDTATAFNPYAYEADENGCALHQLDTDEDGVNEHLDTCPDTLPFEIVDPVGCAPYQLDSDNDGLNDAVDDDDDNDGYSDEVDALPFDPNEHLDTDTDRIGDNADTDIDGDGYTNEEELAEGTDPLDWQSNEWSERELQSLVPRTGERLSFRPNDDGSLRLGVPKVFRRDHEKEIVHDMMHGLIWQDDIATSQYHTKAGYAEGYCRGLEHGGISDWRRPNRLEMLFLMEYFKANKTDLRFPNAFQYKAFESPNDYWDRFNDYGYAIQRVGKFYSAVSFEEGRLIPQNSDYRTYVRCVSGPEQHIPNMQKVEGKNVTIDTTNSLMWEDGPDLGIDRHLSWDDAILFCDALSLNGHDDWRVPNLNESHTLLYEFDRYSDADAMTSSFNHVPSTFETSHYTAYGNSWSSTAAYAYEEDDDYSKQGLAHTVENKIGYWKFEHKGYGNNWSQPIGYMYNQESSSSSNYIRCVRTYAEPSPAVESYPDAIDRGDTITLNASGSRDIDGSIVEYRWTDVESDQIVGNGEVLTFESVQSDIKLQLTVVDNDGLEVTLADQISIKLTDGPIITSNPVTSATSSTPYKYDVEATDPDGDALTYSLTVAPDDMWINANTGVISWVPGSIWYRNDVGDHAVTVQVSDGQGGSDSQSFTIHVVERNFPPYFYSSPITQTTLTTPYYYDVGASDSNGDTLTYSLSQASSGMLIDNDSGEIFWDLDASDLGVHAITVEVTDGEHSVSQSFELTVSDGSAQLALGDINQNNTVTGTPEEDFLVGGRGEDELIGLKSNDLLFGGPDDDTYVIGFKDGIDRIFDVSGLNRIDFVNSSITYSDIISVASKQGDTLVFNIEWFDQQIRIENFFRYKNTIELLTFEDGSTLTAQELYAAFGVSEPTESANSRTIKIGTGFDDVLTGGLEGDIVIGGLGDDRIRGLAGDDVLLGGAGNDIYEIDASAGQNWIIDTQGTNTVVFQEDVEYADAVSNLSRNADDLLIGYGNEGGQVRLHEFFARTQVVAYVEFHTGQQLTATDLYNLTGAEAPSSQIVVSDLLSHISTATGDPALDSDNDTVSDADDFCPYTPSAENVDANGCSVSQADADSDGVSNAQDKCPGTVAGQYVDAEGCSAAQFALTAPNAVIDGPTVIALGSTLELDASQSTDDGSIVSYTWVDIDSGATVGSGATLSISDLAEGQWHYRLIVEDDSGLTDQASITVNVQAANQPPVINSTPVTEAVGGSLYSYAVQATDPDGDALAFDLGAAAPGMMIDNHSGEIVWTPQASDVGTYTVSVEVSDAESTVTQTYELTVSSDIIPVRELEVCPPQTITDDFYHTPYYPEQNLEWTGGDASSVEMIEQAFNHARLQDPSVFQYLDLPSQSEWDALDLQQKGLYLVNAERTARGIKPYAGADSAVINVAQTYADYILNNNQQIGHYNDGMSPAERLDIDPYTADNRDAYLKTESLANQYGDTSTQSAEYAVVRSIFNWLYRDKDWFEDFDWATGPAWGHRDHLLQTGLNENNGELTSEGAIGFGVSLGNYYPGGDSSSRYGYVAVFQTVDTGSSWDDSRLVQVDTAQAQLCNTHHVIDVDPNTVPTQGLQSLTLDPGTLYLVAGQVATVNLIAHYEDGSQTDITAYADYVADNRSVVDIEAGMLTAQRLGTAYVSARVGDVWSNATYVNVWEAADTSNIEGTDVEPFLDYVPDNATQERYDPMALSVYTGLVTDRDGYPLENVHVSVLNEPGYGSTTTDINGRFTLTGPAGEQTLVYEKTGYLVVQQTAIAASDAWHAMETVMLLPRDEKQTFIDLTSGQPQVHESTVVTDEFGSRKATVVFNGITGARIRSADGTEREIDQFWLSATEFETPESMPGALPEGTDFTYATDLDVAGTRYTDTVLFDGYVVMYVDNFLGFDVGEIVPIGYFDRIESEWVASENGVVVQLLDQNGDGVVDGVDYTGDYQPDDLTQDGSTTDEAIGLNGYQAGDTLWWGRFNHMTPVDYNWATDDAQATPWYDWVSSSEDPENCECAVTGSYAKPYQQSFHEDIPITGTGMTLHYSSQRTDGYKHKINVTVSGDSIPASMSNMIARLEIAGRVFEEEFVPAPNLEAEFIWDGTHPDGTRPEGLVRGRISIGHEYPTTYMSNGNAASDGQPLSSYPTAWATVGDQATAVPGREAFISWQRRGITLKNSFDRQLANGWSLSNVHEFDPKGTVYLGNGEVTEVANESLILKTGQTFSHVDGDDGYYQAGGSTIDYGIGSDGILVDEVTGLEWQYLDEPMRTTSKTQAINYCANEAEPLDSGWRLPTPKEIGYTIEKSGANLGPRIYSLVQARGLWHQNTLNINNQMLTTLCVRGETLDSRTVSEFKRDAGKSVVVDGENGLMWQDDNSNTSITLDWEGAVQYCEASNHANYDDWRLPNINELLYALPNEVFQHQTTLPPGEVWYPTVEHRNPYWSATTHLSDDTRAWAIESASFNSEQFLKTDAYHVRCVREASSALRMPYRFNEQGQHNATLDLDSGVTLTTFGYDNDGRLQTMTDRFGNTTTIHREANGVPTRIVTEDGFTTWLEIDSEGNLYEVRYGDNSRFRFNYQSGGLLTGKTDRRGFGYSRSYDNNGRIIEVTDPAGALWTFSDQRSTGQNQYGYSTNTGDQYQSDRKVLSNGDIETVSLQSNKTLTSWIRSEDDLRESVTRSGMTTVINKVLDPKTEQPIPQTSTVTTPSGLASLTTFQKNYAENGADTTRYALTVDENGRTTTVEVDAQVGSRTITTPEGRTTTFEHDPQTLLLSRVSVPGLPDTVYHYDSRGRMLQTTVNDRIISYGYGDPNDRGLLSSITTADGKTTEYDYDALGRLTQTYLPDGNHSIGYNYDENGNLSLITLPTGELHAFDYTERDQKEEYEPPHPDDNATDAPLGSDHPITRYSYNLDKQLEAVHRPDGTIVEYVYNSDTRQLNSLHSPQGTYTYGYYGQNDAVNSGQIKTITAPGGQQIGYQYDGTLVTQLQWTGTITGTLSYQYNEHFEPISQSINGDSVSMSYNLDGQLIQAGALTLNYVAENGLQEGTQLGQTETSLTHNAYGELKAYGATVGTNAVYHYELQRDEVGRIVGKTETVGAEVTQYDYGYDNRDRLVEVRENGVTVQTWNYDANGNRTHEEGALVGTYDSQDRLISYKENNYRYTANGELTTKTNTANNETTHYDYDAFSNLRSVTLPDNTQIDYVIDGQNRRVGKKRNGQLETGFLYSGQLNPIAELDGNNNVIARFVYADKGHVPSYMIKDNTNYRIVSDHLGSVRLVINAQTGEVQQRLDYDAWGNVTNDTNPGFQPFGYAGGIYDRDTNLVRFGARDYDPEIGRWLTKDSIGFSGGLNHYAYVGNDPANLIDPSGLAGMVVYFNGYSVDTGMGFSLPLGHAGVIAIDNTTGTGQYFDFGRYGGEYGDVRGPFEVGSLSFDENGMPTVDSLHAMRDRVSEQFGKDSTVTFAYNGGADSQKIIDFALYRQSNTEQYPYTLNPLSEHPLNFCDTFAVDALRAGMN